MACAAPLGGGPPLEVMAGDGGPFGRSVSMWKGSLFMVARMDAVDLSSMIVELPPAPPPRTAGHPNELALWTNG